MALLQRLEIAG